MHIKHQNMHLKTIIYAKTNQKYSKLQKKFKYVQLNKCFNFTILLSVLKQKASF
jgi:hypothetical protein